MRFCLLRYFFTWVALLTLGKGEIYAQQAPDFRLSANYKQRALTDILAELEDQYPLSFSYLANTLSDKIINRSFQEAAWPEIENYLFKHNGIQAKVLSDGYVVLTTLPYGTPVDWDICLRLTDELGTEMPFVTAALANGKQSFYSDSEGWCRKKITASPNDSLTFNFLGYQQLRMAVSDASGARCPVLALEPSGFELASVEIIEEYLTDGVTSSLEGREVTLRPSRLAALPGFTEKEVYRSAQLLPGINTPDESAGKLSIRGGAPDQTHVLWDGINVYASGHYFGMISFFSPALIDEMRIWRGQAKADYGGRLSGLLEMNTSRDITPRLAAGVSMNLTHADAYVKVPLIKGKSDLHVSGRNSLTGLVGNPTYQSFRRQVFQNSFDPDSSFEENAWDDFIDGENQVFNFTELNARWQWNPDAKTSITISGFSQADEFSNSLEAEIEDFLPLDITQAISTRNDGLSATFKRRLPNGSSFSLQAAHSNYQNENDTEFSFTFLGFADSDTLNRGSTIEDFTFKADYRYPLGGQNIFKAGLQFQRLNSSFFYNEQGTDQPFEAIQEPFDGDNAVAYGTYSLKSIRGLRADLGFRLQYYAPTNSVYPEPRLTASYQLSKTLKLKGGYGVNHQFSNQVVELDFDQLSGVTPLWALADGEDKLVSSAAEATGGFLWKKKGWLVDVEAYHKKIDNFYSLNLLGPTEEEEDEDFLNGESRSFGVDFLVKKRWKNFNSWATYTLSKTDWRFTEISPNFFPAANDRRHQLKWVNSFETNHWLFSLGWQYRTGNRFSPPSNTGLIIAPDGMEPDLIQREGLNADVLPDFHRLDFSAFYQWGAKARARGVHGKVGISLLNIYNRRNTSSRSFRLQGNEIEDNPFGEEHETFFVESIERFGLGFTPNLSISVGWR